MKKANDDADISRRNQGRLAPVPGGGRMMLSASAVRVSDLALGVGDSLDQVVAAHVGGDLAGQALLDLDVELVGPGEVPGLIDRRADFADIGRLVPNLQDLGDVAPGRPACLD